MINRDCGGRSITFFRFSFEIVLNVGILEKIIKIYDIETWEKSCDEEKGKEEGVCWIHPATGAWMAPSGGRSLSSRSPPVVRKRASFRLTLLLHAIIGCVFSALIFCAAIVILPFLVLLRFFGLFKQSGERFEHQRCSHNWPLCGKGNDVACLFLEGDVSVENLRQLLTRFCTFLQKVSSTPSNQIGQLWDQERRRLRNLKDLQRVLSDVVTSSSEALTVSIVKDFESDADSSPRTLILISCSAVTPNLCIFRTQCIMSSFQLLCISLEPQHNTISLSRYSRTFYKRILNAVQCAVVGPWMMVCLAIRQPCVMWKQIEHKHGSVAKPRRRLEDSRHGDQVQQAPLTSSVQISVPPEEEKERVTVWCDLPSPEMLNRAEKLLRATSEELLLSLVASTLRHHFRSEGVLHPPDVGVCVPMSCRSFRPVTSSRICDTLLVPFQLPTSVEGAIPRLWSVQRRLSAAANGSVRNALKLSQTLGRKFLPDSYLRPLFRRFYRFHRVQVAFYRYVGSEKFCSGSSLDSLLVSPSLDPSVTASFVFLHVNDSITVCASLSTAAFSKPRRLLDMFKSETQKIIGHLSIRLLSLPQTTILCTPPLEISAEESRFAVVDELSSPEQVTTSDGPETSSEVETKQDFTLEELYDLLAVVQEQLDGMRANPQGDRGDYVQKLAALESRMHEFHSSIAQRHKANFLKSDAVESVLAPYKSQNRGRRFSREYNRTEGSASRKASF
ncbi:unnamed protein product [Caenorhabditis auriculariae]|uniref:Uncharacterized protein n=1 Tax=Caenorhabditis auriculariae TaxID=2777116 RepID=A0A8S1GZM2_9PELO|nr:unnamed protein product [Caenorhabditis auriculariae]